MHNDSKSIDSSPDRHPLKIINESGIIDNGLKEIIQNLLELNPYLRWTAAECLAHPIFDDIRLGHIDPTSTNKIKLAVDQDDAFDYVNGTSHKFSRDDHISNLFVEVDLIQ